MCLVYQVKTSCFFSTHQNYAEIVQGAEAFFADIKAIFGQTNLYLEGGDLVAWANIFCDYPSCVDVEKMTEVRLAVDVSHHRSIPLFSTKTSLADFLKQPKTTLNMWKGLVWRTPIQSLLLHVFKPLKVKKSHAKHIKIGILPYLKTRYFIWTLLLFKRFSLQLTLGNYNKHHS
ncbi:hypothetical protein [Acinetobacter genomosp. 15BJ]|uniref:Uncharacterized protein n=1 Tax=Acinetobacter genomosp. 15BJ TaxID=106651 RepID=A0ABT8V1K5_9GAMM|nr:hypothetical protein [Acinetobacter genomosp. 15BJ]MDO3659189.1 hypothetical protein [Acinetobacter genomosp. 15BJ]